MRAFLAEEPSGLAEAPLGRADCASTATRSTATSGSITTRRVLGCSSPRVIAGTDSSSRRFSGALIADVVGGTPNRWATRFWWREHVHGFEGRPRERSARPDLNAVALPGCGPLDLRPRRECRTRYLHDPDRQRRGLLKRGPIAHSSRIEQDEIGDVPAAIRPRSFLVSRVAGSGSSSSGSPPAASAIAARERIDRARAGTCRCSSDAEDRCRRRWRP